MATMRTISSVLLSELQKLHYRKHMDWLFNPYRTNVENRVSS